MTRADRGTAVAAAVAVLLGACSLSPVYATGDWWPPVVLTVAVVVGAGLLLRGAGPVLWSRLTGGRPVPLRVGGVAVPLVPLVQLGLIGCVLTAEFASHRAFAGLVPTWSSLRDLGVVLANGSAELREQAVPALPLAGLLSLTVVLVGLIAVAVDLVAVAGQQPALAGLGLLVLFCVPVSTISGGVGLLAIAGPAAGLALLLWAGQRRRLAQRRPGHRSALGTGTMPAVRTGLLALAVGLIFGTLVPTLAEGTLATGLGSGAGPQSSTGTSLDPVVTMHGQLTRPDPIDLLRVQASVPDPGYLRAVSLDQYDGENGWTLSNLNGETSVADTDRLAPLPTREESRQVGARISVLGHDDRFLPVLNSPLKISVADPQNWRFDVVTGTVFGRDTTSFGRTYLVTASEPRPSVPLLENSGPLPASNPLQQRYTQLPPLSATVTNLVGTLTAKVVTPYDRVRAILDYFTDPANDFIYSLSTAPGTSGDHLVDFLRFKRGYCEQFAGAMAVMVRAAGVPARVALGYTPGKVQPGGARLITSDDAHAWVEVYFADLGWVPFDPTPISTDRAVTLPWAPRVDNNAADPTAGLPTAAVPTQAGPTKQLDRGDQFTPLALPGRSAAWVRPALLGGGALLLIAAVAAVPAVLRRLQRRRRLADGSPAALWDELAATAADLGLRLHPAQTPRQTARQLAEVIGGTAAAVRPGRRRPDPDRLAVDAVRRLALAEEAASYARPGHAPAGPPLGTALRDARRGLLRATPRRGRLRALVWPASLVSGAWSRWADRMRARVAAVGRRRTRPV